MVATNFSIMNDVITELKKFGCVGLKAEFEAEGTRDDELIWLSNIARKNDLPITLKIGGCEAIRDLYVVKQFGVEKVVAPMIESPYALKKYIQSIKKIFPFKDRSFLFNIETISGYNNILPILDLAKSEEYIDGIVFGRVDFTSSLDQSRDSINTPKTTEYINSIGELISDTDMLLVVGGGIDNLAYEELQHMTYMSHFETRKIIFDSSIIKSVNKQDFCGIIDLCTKFELAWLEHKCQHYDFIANEDKSRIEMLKTRYHGEK